MGKTLVIKGADFSPYAISTLEFELLVVNGVISGSTSTFGDWDVVLPSFTDIRLKADMNAGVPIAAGQSVTLSGVAGLGIGYYVYSANNPTHQNCLTTRCQSTPVLNPAGNNTFTYQNTGTYTVYVWFTFKWNGTDGEHAESANISPSDVTIKYS